MRMIARDASTVRKVHSTVELFEVHEAVGLEERNPTASGPDQACLAKLPEHWHDDLANGADRIGELLLTDPGDELGSLLLLGCEVEKVPRNSLANGRERSVRQLSNEGQHSLTCLGQKRPREPWVPIRHCANVFGSESKQL